MNAVHTLNNSFSARVARRATPLFARRVLKFKRDRPLVSFTFDDCPLSAVKGGVNPLSDQGWKSTIYVAAGLMGKTNHHGKQLTAADVIRLQTDGHEIGGHTFSHLDAQSIGMQAYMDDIQRNQDILKDMGLPPSRTFAYPYGVALPGIKKKLESQFEGLRGIYPGAHIGSADLNQIKSIPLFSGKAIESAKRYIQDLAKTPGWITFFTHDISDSPTHWGCKPSDIKEIIDLLTEVEAEVLPVDRAIDTLRGTS